MLMQVTLLCGKIIYLQRDKTDTHKYQTADMQWTGTLRGHSITISRADGWALTYWDGHILKMRTDTGRVFDWVTAGNIVTEIREEGSKGPAPFQLSTTGNGVPNGFYVNGKLYSFTLENKPRVVKDGVVSAIASLDPSLGSITWPDKTQEKYTFEVDTSTLTPNFQLTDKAGKQSVYTWDPATLNILSDGMWKYEVGPTQKDLDVPKIARRNDQGQDEFIAIDLNAGTTETKDLKGNHEISERFISPGPLNGKVHKVEQVDDKGGKKLLYQAAYDEQGRLLRETDPTGFTMIYKLDPKGDLIGRSILPPTDPQISKELQNLEAEFLKNLKDISQDKTRSDLIQNRLQVLAMFYIYKMHAPDKALALTPQFTDRNILYLVKVTALNNDVTLTDQQKIIGYQKLIEEFPDQNKQLNFLIQATTANMPVDGKPSFNS